MTDCEGVFSCSDNDTVQERIADHERTIGSDEARAQAVEQRICRMANFSLTSLVVVALTFVLAGTVKGALGPGARGALAVAGRRPYDRSGHGRNRRIRHSGGFPIFRCSA
jgi:hypothetical protein